MVSASVLKNIPLFEGLSEKDIQTLSRCVYERSYRAGDMVYAAGESSEELYVIASGDVIITYHANHNALTLTTLGDGFFFGELGILEATQPHLTHAQATADTRLLLLSDASFQKLNESHPRIALHLLDRIARTLSQRLTEDTMRIGVVHAISRLLSDRDHADDIKQLAEQILSITMGVIGCARAFLGVHPKHNPRHISVLASQGLNPKELPNDLPADSDTYLRWLKEKGGMLHINQEQYARNPKVFYAKKNLLAHTIKTESDTVGMIILTDKEKGEFTEQNKIILQIITQQIAFALESITMRKEHQAREELKRNYIEI